MGILGQNPCSILNSADSDFRTLWIPGTNAIDSQVAPALVATGAYGTLRTYGGVLTALQTATGNPLTKSALVANTNAGSVRLLQFMKDNVKGQLGNIVMKASADANANIETIVDTFIVGSAKGLGKGNGYTFSTNESPKLTDANIWTESDNSTTNIGNVITNPSSLLGKLLAAGKLLTQAEIFDVSQFPRRENLSPNVSLNQASLLYLYKTQQEGNGLTAEQQTRKEALETRNLKFFASFLCEYCFYKSRYEWLLSKYFTVYTNANFGTLSQSSGAPSDITCLFSTIPGNGPNQAATLTAITQQEVLRAIVYHMACLKTRMTDMRRLLNKINIYYQTVLANINTVLQDGRFVGSEAELRDTIVALESSNKDVMTYMDEANFRKGIVEYTTEKNRYANVMLGFYAFLNIAAIAAIFKVASSE